MSERQKFTTTLKQEIIKGLKVLAVEQDKGCNDLLEEAIADLLKKYGKA